MYCFVILKERSKRMFIIPAFMVASVITTGCLTSLQCRAFYDLSYEQREAKIRASSIEKQIEFYKCGMYQEPPTDYAYVIAEGGEKNIPVLLERLKADSSETFQDDIIHIFEEIAKNGYLHNRRDVIVQLRQVVSTMKRDDIKRQSEQRLKVIEDYL